MKKYNRYRLRIKYTKNYYIDYDGLLVLRKKLLYCTIHSAMFEKTILTPTYHFYFFFDKLLYMR